MDFKIFKSLFHFSDKGFVRTMRRKFEYPSMKLDVKFYLDNGIIED